MFHRLIYSSLLVAVSMMIISCFPIIGVSKFPKNNPKLALSLPKKYSESNNVVLVIPLWHKRPFNYYDGAEKGYSYFGTPFSVPFRELSNIRKIISGKTSFGCLTLATFTGRQVTAKGVYLIFDNGLSFYLPISSFKYIWGKEHHGWIGPDWQEKIVSTIKAEKNVVCDIDTTNFFCIQGMNIKIKLSNFSRKKIIKFIEQISTTNNGNDLDIWKIGSPETSIGNTIKIVTRPLGGKVYFDGKFIGETPVVIENLEKRSYDLQILKDGCEVYNDSLLALYDYHVRSFYFGSITQKKANVPYWLLIQLIVLNFVHIG